MRGFGWCALALIISCPAAQACEASAFVEPTSDRVQDARARIAWKPIKGALSYRLVVESRVAEGAVLYSDELVLGEHFWIPPRDLASGEAVVRVKVSATCKDGVAPVTTLRYRIDGSGECALAVDPAMQPGVQPLLLSWPSAPGARGYEVMLQSAQDGSAYQSAQTTSAAWVMPQLHGAWVAGVRPLCAQGTSGRFRFVTFDLP